MAQTSIIGYRRHNLISLRRDWNTNGWAIDVLNFIYRNYFVSHQIVFLLKNALLFWACYETKLWCTCSDRWSLYCLKTFFELIYMYVDVPCVCLFNKEAESNGVFLRPENIRNCILKVFFCSWHDILVQCIQNYSTVVQKDFEKSWNKEENSTLKLIFIDFPTSSFKTKQKPEVRNANLHAQLERSL